MKDRHVQETIALLGQPEEFRWCQLRGTVNFVDAFRQFGFHLNTPGEEAAKQILKVLCATFADNKIVEELHGNVRNEAISKITKKMSCNTIQSVVRSASVFETRGIRHPAKLTKPLFLRDWKNPKKRLAKMHRIHEAGRHKLGKHWHHVMGPKRWGTISETTLEQGAAAWKWFQHHASGMCPPDVKLEDAYFSKFAVAHEIFTRNTNDENCDVEEKEYFLCLGHSTWACLMWPLSRIAVESGNYFFLMPLESACWVHTCKPLDRNVIPSVPAFYNEFIGLKQTQEECSLPRFYFLRQKYFGCRKIFPFFLFEE